ncbi:hypothetical protein OG500_07030 [Kitasatospora sp. NBC_01250]|uniref:hypothetical protein n=1 Tax=unclassified Kitasatospora TaxID=2633591 RepID=UPI002E0FB54E|nr:MULTISPECIES: hypothetical protein [unclassified Kitasatospora]WSJ65860.1 hypothetical protein OG294_06900 [Kitasatospora sp. NBC_01302]
MSMASPQSGEDAEQRAAQIEAQERLEGVTSEQVQHAQDESRAEGDPYEDAE